MDQHQSQLQVHSLQTAVAKASLPVNPQQPTSSWCSSSLQSSMDISLARTAGPTQPCAVHQSPWAAPEYSDEAHDEVVISPESPGVRRVAGPQMPLALSNEEKKAYEGIFKAWDANNTGYFHGDKALVAFGASGLPEDDLAHIWTLADVDDRGFLTKAEFQVAMGLIYRKLNGMPVPHQLPSELALHLQNSRWEREGPTYPDPEKLVWVSLSRKPVEEGKSNELSKLAQVENTEEAGVKMDPEHIAITEASTQNLVDGLWPASSLQSPPPPSPPQPSLPLKPLPPLPPTSPTPSSLSDYRQRELRDMEDRVQKLSDELADLAPGPEEAESRYRLEEELVSLVIGKIPEAKRKLKAKAQWNEAPQPEKVGSGGVKLRRPPPPPPPLPSMRPLHTTPAPAMDREELLLRSIRAGKRLRPIQTVVKTNPYPLGNVLEDAGHPDHECPLLPAPLPRVPPVLPTEPRGGLLRSIRAGKNLRPTQTVVKSTPPPRPSVTPVGAAESDGGLLRSIRAGKQLRPTRTLVRTSPSPLGNVLEDAGRPSRDSSFPRLLSRPPPPPPPVTALQARVLQQAIPDPKPIDVDCGHPSLDPDAAGPVDLFAEAQSLSSSAPTDDEEEEEYVMV